jgi:hypothetical protein
MMCEGESEFTGLIPSHTYDDRFELGLFHSSSGKFGIVVYCVKLNHSLKERYESINFQHQSSVKIKCYKAVNLIKGEFTRLIPSHTYDDRFEWGLFHSS